MLDRLRARLDLLSRGAQQVKAIERRRDEVVCEYLAEYRKLCSEVGPWEYAADVGAPSEADLQTIAYLAAWQDMSAGCDFIDEAISAAASGFEDWMRAHPEVGEPG